MRAPSISDQLIGLADQALRVVFGPAPQAARPSPAHAVTASALEASERELAGRLMRVNHSGEVCAQALYQGQSLTAGQATVREKLEHAALEENDHLAWCDERIHELGTHTSYLNPVWYTGSFAIGALTGFFGDRWSLGFLAETERQVVAHLESHLCRLPAGDGKSRAILEQMREDEARHATVALESGAANLPEPAKQLMALTSRIMTQTAYWI